MIQKRILFLFFIIIITIIIVLHPIAAILFLAALYLAQTWLFIILPLFYFISDCNLFYDGFFIDDTNIYENGLVLSSSTERQIFLFGCFHSADMPLNSHMERHSSMYIHLFLRSFWLAFLRRDPGSVLSSRPFVLILFLSSAENKPSSVALIRS